MTATGCMAMERHGHILRLFLVVGAFSILSLAHADDMIPGPAEQKWLSNLFLGFLFVATPLFGALEGVVIALIFKLRRWEFVTAIAAMALASVVSTIVILVVTFPLDFGTDSPERSPLWYYLAQVIIGWPFAIFVLRHKKQVVWSGLLASVIAQTVLFAADKILNWVSP